MGLLGGAVEAFAESEIAILDAGDLDVAIAGEFRGHQVQGFALGVEGHVETGGKETGLQPLGADEGDLAGGDALEGEEFLGVDGAVEVDEVAAEVGNFIMVFEADDSEEGAGEAVFTGVEGGFRLAGGRARAGGFLRVDAVGGGLFVSGHGGPFNSGVAWRPGETGWWEREVVWNQRKKVEDFCERRAVGCGAEGDGWSEGTYHYLIRTGQPNRAFKPCGNRQTPGEHALGEERGRISLTRLRNASSPLLAPESSIRSILTIGCNKKVAQLTNPLDAVGQIANVNGFDLQDRARAERSFDVGIDHNQFPIIEVRL